MSKDFRNVGVPAPAEPQASRALVDAFSTSTGTSSQPLAVVGQGGFIASGFIAVWYAIFAFFFVLYAKQEATNYDHILEFIGYFYAAFSLIHLLVLFKVELARKLAVAHGYFLLLGIPIGTILGIWVIRSLKGKTFN